MLDWLKSASAELVGGSIAALLVIVISYLVRGFGELRTAVDEIAGMRVDMADERRRIRRRLQRHVLRMKEHEDDLAEQNGRIEDVDHRLARFERNLGS